MDGEMSYNNSQDDIYAAVADKYLRIDTVRMDEQKPINDNKCQHENLIADPSDTIGEAVYHGCANTQCGVGFYIQPEQ